MALPADVRARSGNDPAGFVDFCSDDNNADEVEKLGLMLPEAAKRRKDAREAAEQARIDKLVEERLKASKTP